MEIYESMREAEDAIDNMTRRMQLCILLAELYYIYAHARISADNAKHEFANVIQYMKEHITEDVSLAELAELLHFGHSYFVKKFKKQMGLSPMKYFARLRTNFAAKLLKETDMTVPEVAAKTGFSDVYYFRTFFRRYMGIQPEAYRDVMTRPKELKFNET